MLISKILILVFPFVVSVVSIEDLCGVLEHIDLNPASQWFQQMNSTFKEHQQSWSRRLETELKPPRFSSNETLKESRKTLKAKWTDSLRKYKVSKAKKPPTSSEPSSILKSVPLKDCNCTRMQNVSVSSSTSLDTSLCDFSSSLRGQGQKTVSFSYYGDPQGDLSQTRGYFKHIWTNLQAIKAFYPGWTMRVYHDIPKNDSRLAELCHIACKEPLLDLCNIREIPAIGNMIGMNPSSWRFLPMLEGPFLVSHFLSRDLDTVISRREVEAVEKWMQSLKSTHVMRDHPLHHFGLMAGTFGVHQATFTDWKMIRDSFLLAMTDPIFWAPYKSYGYDQILLKKYFWPWMKLHHLGHDAYNCQTFPHTQPFPSRRLSTPRNYIGGKIAENLTLEIPCPMECRSNPDWIFC